MSLPFFLLQLGANQPFFHFLVKLPFIDLFLPIVSDKILTLNLTIDLYLSSYYLIYAILLH